MGCGSGRLFSGCFACVTVVVMASGLPLSRSADAAELRYARIEAVVVGIRAYRSSGWKTLPNAEVDAKNFAAVMKEHGARVTELYGQKATRLAIITALDRADRAMRGRRMGRNLVVFYFAGHGTTRASKGYLVPVDGGKSLSGSWIAMGTLQQKSEELARVRHLVMVLGSCFGGTLMRGKAPSRGALKTYNSASVWLGSALDAVARAAITAGTKDQQIPDGPTGQGSAFGNAVVAALRPVGGALHDAADLNKDNCVSLAEWFAHVFNHGKTPQNTPFFGRLPGDGHGTPALCRVWPSAAGDASTKSASRGPVAGNGPTSTRPPVKTLASYLAKAKRLDTPGAKEPALKRANTLFEIACRGGALDGCARLAHNLNAARGIKRDFKRANLLLKRACDAKELAACVALGLNHQRGNGTPYNLKRARALFKKSCNGGELWGCVRLGVHFMAGGYSVEVDPGKAVALLRRACSGGRMDGCRWLAWLVEEGRGVTKDIAQANALYRKACAGGNAGGCWRLGENTEFHGSSTAAKKKRAAQLYAKDRALLARHCGGGDPAACSRLGHIYFWGDDLPRDSQRAAGLLRRGCDGGDLSGCRGSYRLACEQDQNTPLCSGLRRRYAAACDAGLASSCLALGEISDRKANRAKGYAPRQRAFAAANKLYQRGCDGGDSESCHKLAKNCLQFQGCKDKTRAARSFERACDLGDGGGCGAAAESYRTGRGVSKNPTKARAFNARGCALGDQPSCSANTHQ